MRSRRFIFILLSLVGLLHFYIGARLLPDLPLNTLGISLGVLALLASTILIPFGMMSRAFTSRALTERLTWVGMLLMGLFSSLLVFTFLRDLFLLGASWFASPEYFVTLTRDSAEAVIVIALFASVVGFFNARRRAGVVRVDVPLNNLPAALHGFTIAQISDIHVSSTIKRRYIDAIVDEVNRLDADMIAVTGDLVDGSVANLAPHTAPLGRLSARHGAFFVTGNHEYYSGADAWTAEVSRLGLRVLSNEHVVLQHDGAELVVAGVTDYNAHQFNPAQRSDPQAAHSGAPDTTSILLAHQPRSAEAAAAAGFDLQLSGHTHGGQFWPWNHFVRFQQPFTAGLHKLKNLTIYISRGTGYWGPPKRFGAPSEITYLRLVRAT